MRSEILANVIRGDTVESVHRGHLIVIDGGNNLIASAGDPGTPAYYRSACKPLQAVPVIASGAAAAFDYSDAEIAMACASHSGEPMHVRVVKQMLANVGLSEPFLRCGTHLPFNEKEAERMLREHEPHTQLHNNCSGKHAAMLAFAKHIEADLATYEQPEHPVQAAILNIVSVFTDIPKDEIGTGVDGCAAPNFAVPIVAMAESFLKLMSPPDGFDDEIRAACDRIVSSMLQFPELIGGTERLDTMLMHAAPGKLISKVGADGVWLCGVLPSDQHPTGLAIALKIADGDDKRARPVVAVEILRQLGVLNGDDLPEVSPMAIKNRRGDTVGTVEANVNAQNT